MKYTILLLVFYTLCYDAGATADEEEVSSPEVRQAVRVETAEEKFDSLITRYFASIRRWKEQQKGNFNLYPPPVETFETIAGLLSFHPQDIRFGMLRSRAAAWIRIGKTQSTENSEAIQDLLQRSRQRKLDAGFKIVEKSESPVDYGKIYRSIVVRGDEYFSTYFQTIRVQGTYGSHSMAYTYFFEIGLLSRKNTWEAERAEDQLGGL